MYLPAHFSSTDLDLALRLMAEHPLALIVGPDAQGVSFGSHIPLVADVNDGQIVLNGHFARANPHWGWLAQQADLLAVFSGPGAYISPRHYNSLSNVPTWNYAALHVHGAVELIEEPALKDALQKRLIAAFEPEYAEQWRGLPEDYQRRMLGAIQPFRVRVRRWELKLKLSQNRSADERERIRVALAGSERAEDRAIAAWMARLGL